MKKYTLVTEDSQQTKQFAQKLAKELKEGSLITLSGQLGAGKTTFTQGLALGLDINEKVTSPTFTLLKIYESGRLPLYHIDAYRLEGLNQDLGFEDYLEYDGVCVIEWSQFIENILPSQLLNIDFQIDDETGNRELTITANGAEYERIMDKVCTL